MMPVAARGTSNFVNAAASILLGEFDDFIWIRCLGKGNFLNSPLLKRAGEIYIESGKALIVVDLEACTGMDSTFMGTLAGLAIKLDKKRGGALHIARADEKSKDSLDGLGLDFLMEINPEEAVWKADLATIEDSLKAQESPGDEEGDPAQFVLEAHQTLSEVNPENRGKFLAVVEMFENEVRHRKSN